MAERAAAGGLEDGLASGTRLVVQGTWSLRMRPGSRCRPARAGAFATRRARSVRRTAIRVKVVVSW